MNKNLYITNRGKALRNLRNNKRKNMLERLRVVLMEIKSNKEQKLIYERKF